MDGLAAMPASVAQYAVQPAAPEPVPVKAPDYYALQKVNDEINHGPYRDCEWFTQFKIQKLKEMGIPAEKLYVATETTDGKAPNHVVAVVGDWVLDNRKKNPYTRKQMARGGYTPFPDYQIIPGSTQPRGR